jgi:hypothetical protein
MSGANTRLIPHGNILGLFLLDGLAVVVACISVDKSIRAVLEHHQPISWSNSALRKRGKGQAMMEEMVDAYLLLLVTPHIHPIIPLCKPQIHQLY